MNGELFYLVCCSLDLPFFIVFIAFECWIQLSGLARLISGEEKLTELQRDKTFEPSGVSGKLKIVLHDVSGTLIRALGTIERRGYDYRDVHCTQRVDGDFDLLVHIEDTGGPSNLETLCRQLERLYNVVSAEQVGRRKRAERA